MHFIRAVNRGRSKGEYGLKDPTTKARFPFQTRSGSTGNDPQKDGFSGEKNMKMRRSGPVEYLPPGVTDMSGFECPVCGSGVSRDARICPVCKADFVDDTFVCPDCGMPLSSEDRNCGICGTIFGGQMSREWRWGNDKTRGGSPGVIEEFIVEKE